MKFRTSHVVKTKKKKLLLNNKRKIQKSLSKMIERMSYFRKRLRMRVHFDKFISNIIRWFENASIIFFAKFVINIINTTKWFQKTCLTRFDDHVDVYVVYKRHNDLRILKNDERQLDDKRLIRIVQRLKFKYRLIHSKLIDDKITIVFFIDELKQMIKSFMKLIDVLSMNRTNVIFSKAITNACTFR